MTQKDDRSIFIDNSVMRTLTAKAETTRQHILDTGRGLVLSKGFAGLGLQEILSTSGVPKGSFYHYFPSKEAFGCALLEQYVEQYRQRLDTLAEEKGTGLERLMRYWNLWLDQPGHCGIAGQCLVVKLAAEVADLSEDMRRILNAGVARLQARIAVLITEGRSDGSLPPGTDPQALAQVLHQMWLGAALLAKLGQDRTPLQHALAATLPLLTCPAPTPSSRRTTGRT